MKYIKLFEKWGINTDVESQAKRYFDEIKNDDKNSYDFLYQNDTGNYYFKLTIKYTEKNKLGYFTYDDKGGLYINLSNRNDYSTLAHELKHLDRHTRVKKKSKIRLVKLWSDKLEYNRSNYLLYLLDPDEFEAKLHGYYIDIDEYLSKNLPENPEKSVVLKHIKDYLKDYRDSSFLLYKRRNKPIKVENIADENYLKRLFNALIDGDVVKKNTLKYSLRKLSSMIKSVVGLNHFDDAYYNKTIKYINKILNFNVIKFSKKFDRMCYGLVDKYAK